MILAQNTVEENLIDAAQSAVSNSGSEAAEVINQTVNALAGHEAFYEHPTFWVAVSFVLAVGFLARPVGKIMQALLRKRIDDITQRIHDAATLEDDAKKLLAEYEQKFQNAEREAKEILQKSKQEVALIKKERLEKLEREMKIKQDEAAKRITGAQNEALQAISAMASELSIKAVKTAIADKLDSKTQDKLINNSINLIGKL